MLAAYELKKRIAGSRMSTPHDSDGFLLTQHYL